MNPLAKPAQAAFSAWVWGSGFAWMSVGVAATFPLLAVGFPYTKVHRWVTAPVFSSCTKLATMDVRVHYHPDFDRDRPSVYCQNHINLLDGHVAATAIPHAFSGLMNAWQFKIPVYGWLMTASKGIPVHSKAKGKMVDQLSAEARKRKAIGMSILTFPEGHRTMTGNVGPYKRGVLFMARNAEMPVVPLVVRGLYQANNKNMGWSFRPFQRVDVFVGPQLDLSGRADDEIGDAAKALRGYAQYCLDEGTWPEVRTTEDLLTSEALKRPT